MAAIPLIGVTGARIPAHRVSQWPEALGMLDVYLAEFNRVILEAGGSPVQIPRDVPVDAIAGRLDGLIIAGGDDVDPRMYGRHPTTATTELDPQRDRFEMALVAATLEAGQPILGVCRGCQLLNVSQGGTLAVDLEPAINPAHSSLAYPFNTRLHKVTFEAGTTLHDVYGGSEDVNSFHHQAIETPGPTMRIAARAEDGVIEAVEVSDKRAIGVQWHPEFHDRLDPIFEWLIDAAKG